MTQTRIFGVMVAVILSAGFFTSPSQAETSCQAIPPLKLWGALNNASVARYVASKLDGDWQPYLDHLARQLKIISDTQAAGKSVRVRFKNKKYRLSGARLADYVSASITRYAAVKCMAGMDGGAEVEAAETDPPESLDDFMTAAGGEDEPEPVRQNPKPVALNQSASLAAGALRLDISTACVGGQTIFKITNHGADWAKPGVFAIYRIEGRSKQPVSSRRMRLKANQSSSFTVSAAKNPTGNLGIFIDPSWYKRNFGFDATVRCR